MVKNRLFDIVRKANPQDPIGEGLRSLNDPYDMVRFYAGYAQHIALNRPLMTQSAAGVYGVIGSTLAFRSSPEEAYTLAREDILRRAEELEGSGELMPESAKNWSQLIMEENLKFIARLIKRSGFAAERITPLERSSYLDDY